MDINELKESKISNIYYSFAYLIRCNEHMSVYLDDDNSVIATHKAYWNIEKFSNSKVVPLNECEDFENNNIIINRTISFNEDSYSMEDNRFFAREEEFNKLHREFYKCVLETTNRDEAINKFLNDKNISNGSTLKLVK